MKQKVLINKIIPKESLSGKKWFQIATDKGMMSAFDEKIVQKLKENIGSGAELEVIENEQGFKNIKKFYGKEQTKEGQKNRDARSMFISYAKDLIVAGKIEISQLRAFVQEFENIYYANGEIPENIEIDEEMEAKADLQRKYGENEEEQEQ